MTLTEVKVAAASLPWEERIWLAAYLEHLDRAESIGTAEELSARNKRIDKGRYVTGERLKELHAALEAEGF